MATPIPTLSDPPSRDDPVNFPARSDTFFAELDPVRNAVNSNNNELRLLTAAVEADANFVLDFRNRFFGTAAADPASRPVVPPATVGDALEIGDLYYNSTAKEIRVYLGLINSIATWRSIGSYVTGSIDVGNYVRANRFIATQTSFRNAPSANLVISNFGHFVVQTNVNTVLSFAYVPIASNAPDALEFTIDLVTNTGFSLQFPASVRWSGNVVPAFAANRRHLLRFFTSTSGTTWLGVAEVLNASTAGAPVLT